MKRIYDMELTTRELVNIIRKAVASDWNTLTLEEKQQLIMNAKHLPRETREKMSWQLGEVLRTTKKTEKEKKECKKCNAVWEGNEPYNCKIYNRTKICKFIQYTML